MHSICDPSKVRFRGPLAPFASGLAAELDSMGYATTSAANQLRLAVHLSRWLEAQHLESGDLTGPVIDRFVVVRRRDYTNLYSSQALGPVLEYLRRVNAAPPPSLPSLPSSASEAVLIRFRHYLTVERSLTLAVANAYSHWVHPFVEHFSEQDEYVPFAQLRAMDVTAFLTAHLPRLSRKSAQMTACALRSFLRFLYAKGITQVALAEAVPAIGFWKLSGLPQALSPSQVQELLGACDQSTPVGRRDFAVITILARLGLRSSEVSALRLEDVDWASGTVAIHGKGNRIDNLPLPVDVGQALVEYLRDGRPVGAPARTVFVRAVAPFTPLGPSSVSCVVGRAAQRAGLGKIYAHRLRHTAATLTLNAGASLEEVAQLLRHASPATTVIYAKTDLSRLANLERPWPTSGDPS